METFKDYIIANDNDAETANIMLRDIDLKPNRLAIIFNALMHNGGMIYPLSECIKILGKKTVKEILDGLKKRELIYLDLSLGWNVDQKILFYYRTESDEWLIKWLSGRL